MNTSRFARFFLKERSKPQEIAMGIAIAYVLTAFGLLMVGLLSTEMTGIFRMIFMMMFLTLAPMVSFAGQSVAGSASFTIVALMIYIGLWVFAVRKLSGLALRVAAIILVGAWMMFGMWAVSSVYWAGQVGP
jgi:hypothetical protein